MTHPKTIVKQNPHYAQSQKIMFDLRVTRWAEDLYGYSMFLATLLHLLLEHLKLLDTNCVRLEKYQEWKK